MAAAMPIFQAVGSWLTANGGALAASAAGGAAASGATSLLAPDGPKQPKVAEQPVPDSTTRNAENERRLLKAYNDKGRVGSMFGQDKLG